jgi:hypothetical protein
MVNFVRQKAIKSSPKRIYIQTSSNISKQKCMQRLYVLNSLQISLNR